MPAYGLDAAVAQAPREAGPITGQMAHRAKLQSGLEGAIERLQARLAPFLAPPPSATPGNGENKAAKAGNHAQELAAANAHLERMIEWLDSITNRIEL